MKKKTPGNKKVVSRKTKKQPTKRKESTLIKGTFTDEFKDWLENMFHKYKSYFLIDHLRLRFSYSNGDLEVRMGNAVFQIENDVNYHMATVYVYPLANKMFKDNMTKELERGIIHEISHIHTSKISEIATNRFIDKREIHDEIENLTDIISEYIHRYITISDKKFK